MDDKLRNVRIMLVEERDMLQAIGQWETGDKVHRLHCPDIPENAKLLQVYHEQGTRCYAYMFYHPDFDEVPVGMMPPYMQARIQTVKVVANEE